MKNFNRNDQPIIFNPSVIPDNGFVYLYNSWSMAHYNVEGVINCLRYSPDIQLFIYDIDDKQFEAFQQFFQIKSHGKGEIFVVRDKKILEFIAYGETMNKQVIENLVMKFRKSYE